MARILIGYQNRCDEGALSGGNWLAAAPLTNLQDRRISRVARSNGVATAATRFDIDLGKPRLISVLALVVHNISVTGSVRIQGADNAGFVSPQHDSGWRQVWPYGMIPAELLEWEDDNFWLGTLTEEARAGYQSPYIWRVQPPVSCRYWRVLIDDTANPNGYVQIGRLFLSHAWSPSVGNYGLGASLGFEDPTQVDQSLGGAEYFDARQSYRVFRFDLPVLTAAEAYERALEMQRLVGVSGEVLVLPDPDDALNQPRRAFVGRLRQLNPVTQPYNAVMTTSYEVKEIV